jgi:hypothetical protein
MTALEAFARVAKCPKNSAIWRVIERAKKMPQPGGG